MDKRFWIFAIPVVSSIVILLSFRWSFRWNSFTSGVWVIVKVLVLAVAIVGSVGILGFALWAGS